MFGAQSETAALRDRLLGELIGLARATEGNDHLVTWSTDQTVLACLCAIAENAGDEMFSRLLNQVEDEKRKLVPMCYQCAASCGRNDGYDVQNLYRAETPIRGAKTRLLTAICGLAAVPQRRDRACFDLLYRALYAIGREDWSEEELLTIAAEVEKRSGK